MTAGPPPENARRGRPAPSRWPKGLGVVSSVGVVFLNVVVVGAVAFFLWTSHEQATDAAVTTTQNLARLLDDDLSALFERADSALLSVAEELQRQAEDARPDGRALLKLMARQRARAPGVLSLRIIGADGWLGPSDPVAEEPVSLSDRDYFIQLRDGAQTVMSKPLEGRIIKTPVVVLGRRLVDPRGAFAGAVIAAFELTRLAEAISNIDVGRKGVISLITADSTILARRGLSGSVDAVGQTVVSRELQILHEEGRTEGVFQSRSPVDGIVRRLSFRRVGRFPFYVIVGMAPEDYLSAWRRYGLVATAFLLGFAVLTTLGARLVHRMWTQKLRAEEHVMQTKKVESLAVLAGGIAHDFNNLLAAISGNISVAREDVAAGSVGAEALADAEAASKRARSLTHQLLTFSRGGAPVKHRVDLSAVVEEAARFTMHGVGTALRLDVTPDLFVDADPGQVGQVVQNLVLNGIQAMSSSGTLAVGVHAAAVPPGRPGLSPGRYALLTVTDGGPGIPPEVLPRVFDPFFTTKPEGKGLGLAICHSIVAKHEGSIAVESHPGMGTTFGVFLPLTGERAAVEGAPASSTAPARSAATPRRALVMDDEDAVRRLARRILDPLGYEVVEARDGREAEALYAEALAAGRCFALVLMDLTIPGGMGGLEALGKLKLIDPNVVAMVSSGYSNDPVMANWKEHGFSGCLAKPYVAAELREALGRLQLA